MKGIEGFRGVPKNICTAWINKAIMSLYSDGDETVSTGVWKLRLHVESLPLVKRRNLNVNADDYKFALAA